MNNREKKLRKISRAGRASSRSSEVIKARHAYAQENPGPHDKAFVLEVGNAYLTAMEDIFKKEGL
jgi:hypothetical protein